MNIDLSTLEALGFSKEDLIERIVTRAVEGLVFRQSYDEDGDPVQVKSDAALAWDKLITERLDAKIREIGEKHIMPLVDAKVENLVLQETNRWGEKVGNSVTLTEYMVSRAETYMLEEVDYNGKAKREGDGYNWRKSGTRIEYAIDKHLQYSIETAMKQVVSEGNKALVGGLAAACKIKLGEIAEGLKVKVEVK